MVASGLQQRNPSPCAEREEKRRRRDFASEDLPIWSRPPTWMYLPHLGIGGGQLLGDLSSDAVATVHASADGTYQVAGTAVSRGRTTSPGTRTPSAPAASSMQAVNLIAATRDASHPRDAPAPSATAPRSCSDGHRSESKLAARHAGIAISLADHAERVEHKKAQGRPSTALTAAERMTALRRRLEERVNARAEEVPADCMASARGETGGPPLLEGAGHSSCSVPSSKEDAKIHLVHARGGIRLTTAERSRAEHGGVATGASALEDAGGGARGPAPPLGAAISDPFAPVDAASAAAARCVAWHTTETTASAAAEGSN